MAQKKLQRFAEIKTFPNVLEFPEDMAGKWNAFFRNDHPVILELACGKGEYTTGLATLHPGNNYIGVDVKGNRIWVGARYALDNRLNNVAFLRTQIEMLDRYFAAGEVEEIWITFPDPQLRGSKASKRLTHPRFLRLYRKIMRPGGVVHLKTDSPRLFNFTKTVIGLYDLGGAVEDDDVYAKRVIAPELQIQTHYEKLDIAKSKKVFYLQFPLAAGIENVRKDGVLKELVKHGTQE